jgi:hypothetical protein
VERSLAAIMPCYEVGSIGEAAGTDGTDGTDKVSFQNLLNWR